MRGLFNKRQGWEEVQETVGDLSQVLYDEARCEVNFLYDESFLPLNDECRQKGRKKNQEAISMKERRGKRSKRRNFHVKKKR